MAPCSSDGGKRSATYDCSMRYRLTLASCELPPAAVIVWRNIPICVRHCRSAGTNPTWKAYCVRKKASPTKLSDAPPDPDPDPDAAGAAGGGSFSSSSNSDSDAAASDDDDAAADDDAATILPARRVYDE